MAYGIEIKNVNGSIVVDGNYKNFMHLFTRNASLTFRPDNYSGAAEAYEAKPYYFPFAVTSYVPPALGIRVTQNRLATGSWIGSPGNWQGIYMVTDIAGVGNGNKTCSMEIRAYVAADQSQLSLSGSYGMQVFNASGAKVFDSRVPPLIVDSRPIINFPSDPWNRIGQNLFSLGSGKGLDAACTGWFLGRAYGTSGTLNHEYHKAFLDAGGSLTIREVMTAYEDSLVPRPTGLEILGAWLADTSQALVIDFR